jgi:hypothetical protein
MSDTALREQLAHLLRGGHAHAEVEQALRAYPASIAGKKIPGSANTPWRLLEHIRLAQWDILEFSRDARHVSPEFPDGYWPESDAPPEDGAWGRTVDAICNDLQAMVALVEDPATDLFAPIPHGDGQTILREAFLVANHNAYHLGQMMFLQRVMDNAEVRQD